jgi:hypothetical protein
MGRFVVDAVVDVVDRVSVALLFGLDTNEKEIQFI